MLLATGAIAYFIFRSLTFWPSLQEVRAVAKAMWIWLRVPPTGDGADGDLLSTGTSWLILAAGVVFVPAAMLLLALLRQRNAYEWALRAARARNTVRAAWAARVALISALCLASYLAQSVDLAWEHFSATGMPLVLYSAGRALLAFCLALVFVGLGHEIAKLISGFTTPAAPLRDLLIALALGVTACGILGVALGLVGMLKFWLILGLMIVAAWIAAPAAFELANRSAARSLRVLLRVRRGELALALALAWCCAVMVLFLVVSDGLYPVTLDTDVWEHYLHYYRTVLREGWLGPNDVWYHYYLSKGAGSFFIAGILSDFFAAQIVTLTALAVVVLVILDLLRSTTRGISWPLLGALIVVCAVYGGENAGIFFKHHGMFFAFTAFLLWSAYRFASGRSTPYRRVEVVAACAAAAYIGFYLPLIAILHAAMFACCALAFRKIAGTRPGAKPSAIAAFATCSGVFVALALNFAASGLAEVMPIHLMWQFADRLRFDSLVGASGVAYFDYFDSGFGAPVERSLMVLSNTLRIPAFTTLVTPLLVFFAGASLLAWGLNPRSMPENRSRAMAIAVPVFAIILPAAALAWLAQIDSIKRLYVFMNLIWGLASVWTLYLISSYYASARVRELVAGSVIAFAGAAVIFASVRTAENRLIPAARFIAGRLAFAEALQNVEHALKTDRSTKLTDYRWMRAAVGPTPEIFTLTYDPGFGYVVPGAGMRSEPSYTLGPGYSRIISGSADEVARRLKDEGVQYFYVSLQAHLFSSLAFTGLFEPDRLSERFRLIASHADNYLLGWNDGGTQAALPAGFLEVFELKRTGFISSVFSAQFARMLESIAQQSELVRAIERNPGEFAAACRKWCDSIASEMAAAFRQRLDGKFLIQNNRSLMARLGDKAQELLIRRMPDVVRDQPPDVRAGAPFRSKAYAAELASGAHAILDHAFQLELRERFGVPVTATLMEQDERKPFGLIVSRHREEPQRPANARP